MYMCLVVYLWRDFVWYILHFSVVRMRTLHCVYVSCSVFVERFCFVYLAFRFSWDEDLALCIRVLWCICGGISFCICCDSV